jgi:group I intron endonuclease
MSNSIKLKKFHFIYKTTNLLNNKFYIGMHSTSNLKDGYIGSGTNLRRAVRKYGIDNFKFEILEWCSNRDELIKREVEIITEEYINDYNCYNMKHGGEGGFNNQEHQFKCSQAAGIKHRERMLNDSKYRENFTKKISDANKRRLERGDLKTWKDVYNWSGKKHKPETIEKIKLSKKGHGVGENNSQYGTKWITNGIINKKIKKDDSIPDSWWYGITNTKPI